MLDIQGHRGCRGLMPENTIPAFIKALELGVTTLELDVVISKDKKVVVSHEPYMSHETCLNPEGRNINVAEERNFNLYKMKYEEIRNFDCGLKPHPRFPDQQKIAAYKPLLIEVIDKVEAYIKENNHPPVHYNIETKSTPEGDNIFHPTPAEFADLLMQIIEEKKIEDRTIIQSFDVRTLQIIRKTHPKIKLSLLIENQLSPEENLKLLGFTPAIYSPAFELVNQELIDFAKQHKMQVIPWTVNEEKDIKAMLELKVDGIISDYPDRVLKMIKQ